MKKLLNKKGFTLMEMMIVVAIIVILVAISIPTFSTSLNSAKEATDKANLRSAKAAVALAVSQGENLANGTIYDVSEGKFDSTLTTPADDDKGQCDDHTGAYIIVLDGKAVWTEDGSTDAGDCQ